MKCLTRDCAWRHDPDLPVRPREQLHEHAQQTSHALCSVCALSLRPDETNTCETCLTEARALLNGIVTMWAELDQIIGTLPGRPLDRGRSSADPWPLPGGDALVLLTAGSEGWADDGKTSRDDDPASVSYVLGFWAERWQRDLHENEELARRPAIRVMAAAGYLERRCRTAAKDHPGFPAFHTDLVKLHATLERATGRQLRPSKANAACFDCGGELRRILETVTIRQWWLPGKVGPLPYPGTLVWTGPVENVEELANVECRTCRRQYTPGEYALALRASRDSGLEGWVTVRDAAVASRRSVETLESWVKRGLLEVACRIKDRRHLVWWPDVQARTERSQRRRRSA